MTETMPREQILTNLNAMLDAAEHYAARRKTPKKVGVENKKCFEIAFLEGRPEHFEAHAKAAGYNACSEYRTLCDGPVTVFDNEANAIAVVDRGDFRATATPDRDRDGKPTIRWRLLFMVEAAA